MCANLAHHTVVSLLYNTDYAENVGILPDYLLSKELLMSHPEVYQHLQFSEAIRFRENYLIC